MKKVFLMGLCSLFICNFTLAHEKISQHHKHHHVTVHSKSKNTRVVDINHADADELATLKGIGLKKANKIIAYRAAHGNFKSVDDLTKVNGMGVKTLARLETNNPGRITINTSVNMK